MVGFYCHLGQVSSEFSNKQFHLQRILQMDMQTINSIISTTDVFPYGYKMASANSIMIFRLLSGDGVTECY